MHLYSSEFHIIKSGRKTFVETGVSVGVPRGFYPQIVGRYSLSSIGVYVLTVFFDHSYHGTIRVTIPNEGWHDYPIGVGDIMEEILIMPLENLVCVHRNIFKDLNKPESGMMLAADYQI